MDQDKAKEILESAPFHKFLGLSFDEYESGRVVINAPFRQEMIVNNEYDIMHGGILASLLDIAGHYAVLSQAGDRVPTANFRIDYLNAASGTETKAIGDVVRVGSNLAVANAELRQQKDGEWQTVAIGRGSYSVSHIE